MIGIGRISFECINLLTDSSFAGMIMKTLSLRIILLNMDKKLNLNY